MPGRYRSAAAWLLLGPRKAEDEGRASAGFHAPKPNRPALYRRPRTGFVGLSPVHRAVVSSGRGPPTKRLLLEARNHKCCPRQFIFFLTGHVLSPSSSSSPC